MAVGNEEAISAMKITKNNTDSGVFNAVQRAGIKALDAGMDKEIERMNSIYQKRRDMVYDLFTSAGLETRKPKATFYMWVRVPAGYTSGEFAEHVLEKAGVVITPGAAYGPAGEGYFRISLTTPDHRLREAAGRIRNSVR